MSEKDGKLVMIDEVKLKELKLGLNELKLSIQDEFIRNKVLRLIDLLNEKQEDDLKDIADKIYKKMKETDDPELNVKMYMLYRKLEEGKIDESEALRQYNVYVGQEYSSGYIF